MVNQRKNNTKKSSKSKPSTVHSNPSSESYHPITVVIDPNANNNRNVCFTAPDGAMPLLVQSLSLMSFAASFSVWITSWVNTASFACFKSSTYDSTTGIYDYTPICYNLSLNSGMYALRNDVYFNGWEGAIAFGAIFGAIATTLGFIILYSTFSACCFSMSPRQLRSLWIISVIASICQVLTLVSVTSKLGSTWYNNAYSPYRLAEGGALAIAATILYMVLAWFLRDLRKNLVAAADKDGTNNDKIKNDEDEDEDDDVEETDVEKDNQGNGEI